jgi:transcriptional regulator of arginine metabolism
MIIDIVSVSPVRNQKVIVDLLRKNGYTVTQASVSRDLEELSIAKSNGTYRRQAEPMRTSPFGRLAFAVSGESLIVARCSPGMASALAVLLDSKGFEEIVGTIAGDDTVFIAVDDKRKQTALLKRLRNEFTDGE